MSSKNSVEEYLVEELLRDSSNIELVSNFLQKLTKDEIIKLFTGYLAKENIKLEEIKIPLSIFKTKKLSSFELIARFLKEDIGLSNIKIAKIVRRSPQSVWNTYNNAKKKCPTKLEIKSSQYDFPVKVIKNRKYSILENIVVYLKDHYHLRFSEIQKLIYRDQRTIWTVYNRAKKK